ncbi:MAG: hypothetical protein AAED33_07455 [Paracoccaceae bacterium]|jgi:septal ring factor EnvC (AmiA/AmiB activator)
MNELKTLEDRLKSATDRISATLSSAGGAEIDLANLRDENARLQEKLAGLKKQRESDLAEVDSLIEQLRPLMDGGSDA